MNHERAGFSRGNLYRLLGDAPGSALAADTAAAAKAIGQIKEKLAGTKKGLDNANEHHFFLVVVFENDKARLEFTDRMGWDDNRYVDARKLIERIKWPTAKPKQNA